MSARGLTRTHSTGRSLQVLVEREAPQESVRLACCTSSYLCLSPRPARSPELPARLTAPPRSALRLYEELVSEAGRGATCITVAPLCMPLVHAK